MADIFISYASSDRERARQLADNLARRGYSVWWDRTIPPGRVFDEVIQEALHTAKCVIVLWSAQSVRSNWVKTEAAEGSSVERLVPALIERVLPPIEFKRIQAADLTDWTGGEDHAEFRKLLASIDDLLQRPAATAKAAPPPISVLSYRAPGGGFRRASVIAGIAALMVVAAAGYLLGKRGNAPALVAGGSAPPSPGAPPAPSAEPGAAPSSGGGPAAPVATPAKSGRLNLLSSENGGEIVTASHERWAATIDGKEETYAWVDNGQAVFAFKDGRAATFDTFAVLIPSASDNNLGEFELLAGNDGPGGNFTSIGTFKPQNLRIMKQPFQEFHFAPVRAKFLKFRPLKASNGSSGAVMGYEFQLLGTLD
jgi:hypothetical protein